MIRIRCATKEDINSIYNVSKSSIKNSWSLNSFIEDFNNTFSEYTVLINRDQIIGFISIWRIIDEITITNISIKEKYKGIGLSNHLMNYIIENNKNYIMFLEVRESNNIAINLYNKFGFKEIHKRYKYYNNPTENAIIMKKF